MARESLFSFRKFATSVSLRVGRFRLTLSWRTDW